MKAVDVSSAVMKKVTRLEKRQVQVWLGLFFLTVTIFILLAGAFLLLTLRDIYDQDVLILLQLLISDPEGFWQDAVPVLSLEIPWDFLVLGVSFLVALAVTIFLTESQRRVVSRKQKELQRYQ